MEFSFPFPIKVNLVDKELKVVLGSQYYNVHPVIWFTKENGRRYEWNHHPQL